MDTTPDSQQQRHQDLIPIEWLKKFDRYLQSVNISGNALNGDNASSLPPVDWESIFSKTCVPFEQVVDETLLDDTTIRTVLASFYAVIWLAGLSSNAFVLAVVSMSTMAANRKLGGGGNSAAFPVRSVFVASLACSDLLVSLTSLPATAINSFTHIWIFPVAFCNCVSFFQAFSVFQSSFTFTCIAIDRYLLIVHPKRLLINYKMARSIVLITALFAAALASPMAIYVRTMDLSPVCGQFCIEWWPHAHARAAYGILVLLLQFGLPIAVTSLCYSMIANKLRPTITAPSLRRLNKQEAIKRRSANLRRHRTNRMMACMVGAFAIFWAPLNILNIMRDFNLSIGFFQQTDRLSVGKFHFVYAVAHLFAMISLIWNPIMYACFNGSIRKKLLAILNCGVRCGSRNAGYREANIN